MAPLRLTVLLLCAAVLSGCATKNSTPLEPYDPYEETNREVFQFNQTVDRYVLEPVASAYSSVTPRFFRRGVDNFFENASYPGTIVNDLLQGKGRMAVRDTGRFLVNTTVGLLGIWDPASRIGLPARDEDFSQTLAVWGVDSGPYLELPALGPNEARDLPDYPLGSLTNVLNYTLDAQTLGPLWVLYFINKRAMLDKAVKIREQAALDPYSFTRNAYIQYRRNQIYDGNPPQDDDLYDESLFDEEFDDMTDEPVAPNEQ